jgi:asparagine N-glycosylation enzyme membrane subunit Stt3
MISREIGKFAGGQRESANHVRKPAYHLLSLTLLIRTRGSTGRETVMGLIILIILILLLVGGLPTWPHSREWGYGPSGLLGLLVAVAIVLLLLGYLPRGF